jgi:hypothetical protein
MRKPILAGAALGLAVVAGFIFFRPRSGIERFIDTFRYDVHFGAQEITLKRDGSANYSIAFLDSNDVSRTEVSEGRYRVVGDTAFVGLAATRPEGTPAPTVADTSSLKLVLVIKGDSLVWTDFLPGASMAFVRK